MENTSSLVKKYPAIFTTEYAKLIQSDQDKQASQIKERVLLTTFWSHGQKLDYNSYSFPLRKRLIIVHLIENLLKGAGNILLTIYHLGQAVLIGSYQKVIRGNGDYFFAKTFSVIRDLEAVSGYAAIVLGFMLNSVVKWGYFHVEQAQYHKSYYDYYLENRQCIFSEFIKKEKEKKEDEVLLGKIREIYSEHNYNYIDILGQVMNIHDPMIQQQQFQKIIKKVFNKGISESEVIKVCEAFDSNVKSLKLFFMGTEWNENCIRALIDFFKNNYHENEEERSWMLEAAAQLILKTVNEEPRKQLLATFLGGGSEGSESRLTCYLKYIKNRVDLDKQQSYFFEVLDTLYKEEISGENLLVPRYLDTLSFNKWVIQIAKQDYVDNRNENPFGEFSIVERRLEGILKKLSYDCPDLALFKYTIGKNQFDNIQTGSLIIPNQDTKKVAPEVLQIYFEKRIEDISCGKWSMEETLNDRKILIDFAQIHYSDYKTTKDKKVFMDSEVFTLLASKIVFGGGTGFFKGWTEKEILNRGDDLKRIFSSSYICDSSNDQETENNKNFSSEGGQKVLLRLKIVEKLEKKDFVSIVNYFYELAFSKHFVPEINERKIIPTIKDEKDILVNLAKLRLQKNKVVLKDEKKRLEVSSVVQEVLKIVLKTHKKNIDIYNFDEKLLEAVAAEGKISCISQGEKQPSKSLQDTMYDLAEGEKYAAMIDLLWQQGNKITVNDEWVTIEEQTFEL